VFLTAFVLADVVGSDQQLYLASASTLGARAGIDFSSGRLDPTERLPKRQSALDRSYHISASVLCSCACALLVYGRVHDSTQGIILQTFLSTNTVTPLWVFFIIAIPSVFVTLLFILFLKWMEKEEDTWLRRTFRIIFWKKKTALPQLSYEDAVNLKIDPSLLLA